MNRVENRFIAVISLIYAVGIAGFIIPALRPLFIWLTPYNIAGAFAVAWLFHPKWSVGHAAVLALIGVLGFALEWAGVQTGQIFGTYYYGKTLGPGWNGIPYLIGLNWAAMTFYVSSLLAGRSKHNALLSLGGAAMMTLYDFFLEPVAVRFDFWHWRGPIPMQNYMAWFVASFLFLMLLFSSSKPSHNRVAGTIYFIQLLFFMALFAWIRLF
ncbi:MAG: carotenoid biosynthesis protein [Bacteroidia bacterium]